MERMCGRAGSSCQLTHSGSASSSVSQASSRKPAAAVAASSEPRGSVAIPKPLATSARMAEIEEMAWTRAWRVSGVSS